MHHKELKRCQCEENSVFYKEHLPVLHDRYGASVCDSVLLGFVCLWMVLIDSGIWFSVDKTSVQSFIFVS